jgi:polyisoprenoid-binding protein YceI
VAAERRKFLKRFKRFGATAQREIEKAVVTVLTLTLPSALLIAPLLSGLTGEGRAPQGPRVPDSVVYRVDPSSSRLVVKTGKAGLFGFAGHTHVIRARSVSGELVYRPGTPRSHLRLTIPTDSLEVLTPPDTAEIRKVTQAMRTEVLHVDKYPEMTFAADSLNAKSGKMEMQLAVTMEGTTRKLPVTADVIIGADSIRARGSFTAKQTDFGIKPFSGGPAGTVKVADRVTFCFDLIARPQGARGGQPLARNIDATTVPGCVDKAEVKPEERRPM